MNALQITVLTSSSIAIASGFIMAATAKRGWVIVLGFSIFAVGCGAMTVLAITSGQSL